MHLPVIPSLPPFERDAYKSHYKPSRQAKELIDTLVKNSKSALEWLEWRLQVDISQVAQLGGHSHARTHRPSRGMIGATLMLALFDQLRLYQESKRAKILTASKAKSLITTESGGARVHSLWTNHWRRHTHLEKSRC